MQNKIVKTYNTVDDNKIKITKLDNEKLKKIKYFWHVKNRESVLLDNHYTTSLNQEFLLENISEDILKCLKIVTYITNGIASDDDGLKYSNLIDVLSWDTHLVMTSVSTAKLYVQLYIVPLTEDYITIPTYWNLKLVYKPLIRRV